MDPRRFDALTRAVGTPTDRRGALKTVAAGALGLVGLAALGGGAAAKKCDNNNDCNGKKDICDNGKCVECKNNNDCDNDEECRKKKCKKK